MKRIKGFTLVELLAVIVVLGILVGIAIVMYTKYVDKTKENIIKIEEKNILDSAAAYYNEFKDTPEYVKETIYKDNQTVIYSCVSLKSIIERGYFKSDVNFSESKITKEDTIVKITTVNGVTDYEILNDYDEDDVCTYYKLNKDFDNISTINNSSDDDNNVVSFSSTVSNVVKKKDLYNLNFDLKLDFTDLAKNYPVYVLLVLDRSGSMADNYNNKNQKRFTRSRDASIKLSKEVVAINNNSYIGLIQFNNSASNVVNFKRTPLTTSNFASATGNTNIIAGLDKAMDMISALPEDSMKYVIFLSDGYPYITPSATYGNGALPQPKSHYAVCTDSKVTDKCKNTLIDYRNKFEAMNTTFVVVGYEMGISAYKEVASADNAGYKCPNATLYNGVKRCYYESTSSNVANLFSSISAAILDIVANINRGQIKGRFNDGITVYDSDTGEEIKDLVIDISFDREKYVNVSQYEYLFHVNDSAVAKCTDTKCQFVDDLVTNFTLDLYSKNDIFIQTMQLDSPILKIDAKKDSYLN